MPHEPSPPRPPASVDLLGFRFHDLTEHDCVEYVLASLRAGRGGWVVTPNLDIMRMMSASRDLWEFLSGADLVVADGMPIVWASRILGRPLPERIAGSSLVSTLSEGAARAGRSLYLLGGDPGTAEAAAEELRRRYPDLRIAGTDCPPLGFDRDPAAVAAIAHRLALARPDIVYVALGCPKQERLIARIRAAAPNAWWMGVGISFSYLAGAVKRAPAWMRGTGLEWVARLVQEPGRLAKRYLRDGIPFALRLGAMATRARLGTLLGLRVRSARLSPRSRAARSGSTGSVDAGAFRR